MSADQRIHWDTEECGMCDGTGDDLDAPSFERGLVRCPACKGSGEEWIPVCPDCEMADWECECDEVEYG